MALVIEDGSLVADANSFVTRAEYIAYAALRGVLIADTAAADIQLITAADYLLYREPEFMGLRVELSQALPFPRENIVIGLAIVGNDEIPALIKRAQMQLALEINNGVVLIKTKQSSAFVTRRKIGPLEQEFSEAVELSGQLMPSLPLVDAILSPIIQGGGGPTRAYRV